MSEQPLSVSHARVYAVVRKYAGMPLTGEEIAAELGFHKDHCVNVATKLVRAGVLERSGNGRCRDPFQYALPASAVFDEDACRMCGCTEDNACHDPTTPNGGCYWVEPDLCSVCAFGIGGGA